MSTMTKDLGDNSPYNLIERLIDTTQA